MVCQYLRHRPSRCRQLPTVAIFGTSPSRSATPPRCFCSKPREGKDATEREQRPVGACSTSRIEATTCRQLKSCYESRTLWRGFDAGMIQISPALRLIPPERERMEPRVLSAAESKRLLESV